MYSLLCLTGLMRKSWGWRAQMIIPLLWVSNWQVVGILAYIYHFFLSPLFILYKLRDTLYLRLSQKASEAKLSMAGTDFLNQTRPALPQHCRSLFSNRASWCSRVSGSPRGSHPSPSMATDDTTGKQALAASGCLIGGWVVGACLLWDHPRLRGDSPNQNLMMKGQHAVIYWGLSKCHLLT